MVNALLIILFLSDTVGGRIHDKRLAEATPYPLPAGSRLLQDLGFMAFTLPQVEILMPRKKPPGAELSPAQQTANQKLWGVGGEGIKPSSLAEPREVPMAHVDDLSRCLTAFDQNTTLVVVVEMSEASWLVAGMVPGRDAGPRPR